MKTLKKIISFMHVAKWLVMTSSLTPSQKIFVVINRAILSKSAIIVDYSDKDRSDVVKLIIKVKNEVKMHMEINEAYQLFMAVKRTQKVNGDIAEVGVFQGGSSKLICEAKKGRPLHLFDTFEGLPELSKEDEQGYFSKGEFDEVKLEEVKSYLKKYSNVYFYKGFFPSTAKPIKDKKFSFVNLDVDIYESTLSCLKFFYPRMSKGGIIISHDYINAIGVRKAFERFFRDKKEPIIELSGSQCLIVKV